LIDGEKMPNLHINQKEYPVGEALINLSLKIKLELIKIRNF